MPGFEWLLMRPLALGTLGALVAQGNPSSEPATSVPKRLHGPPTTTQCGSSYGYTHLNLSRLHSIPFPLGAAWKVLSLPDSPCRLSSGRLSTVLSFLQPLAAGEPLNHSPSLSSWNLHGFVCQPPICWRFCISFQEIEPCPTAADSAGARANTTSHWHPPPPLPPALPAPCALILHACERL